VPDGIDRQGCQRSKLRRDGCYRDVSNVPMTSMCAMPSPLDGGTRARHSRVEGNWVGASVDVLGDTKVEELVNRLVDMRTGSTM
jgi:hypothetical protein